MSLTFHEVLNSASCILLELSLKHRCFKPYFRKIEQNLFLWGVQICPAPLRWAYINSFSTQWMRTERTMGRGNAKFSVPFPLQFGRSNVGLRFQCPCIFQVLMRKGKTKLFLVHLHAPQSRREFDILIHLVKLSLERTCSVFFTLNYRYNSSAIWCPFVAKSSYLIKVYPPCNHAGVITACLILRSMSRHIECACLPADLIAQFWRELSIIR